MSWEFNAVTSPFTAGCTKPIYSVYLFCFHDGGRRDGGIKKSVLCPILANASVLERFVDDLGHRRVQVWLDSGEQVPPANLHHHPWIHLLIDQEPLDESTPEVVTGDVPEVFVADRLGGTVGGSFDPPFDGPLRVVDDSVGRSDLLTSFWTTWLMRALDALVRPERASTSHA